MGMKPPNGKYLSVASLREHCAFARGELRSWIFCECYLCTTKQIEGLEKQLAKAKKREGIK